MYVCLGLRSGLRGSAAVDVDVDVFVGGSRSGRLKL